MSDPRDKRAESSQDESARQAYNFVADKVGFVPNIRVKDNLYQGLATLVFGLIGAVLGVFMTDGGNVTSGALMGLLGGLLIGILLSGAVLTVVGLVRKS